LEKSLEVSDYTPAYRRQGFWFDDTDFFDVILSGKPIFNLCNQRFWMFSEFQIKNLTFEKLMVYDEHHFKQILLVSLNKRCK